MGQEDFSYEIPNNFINNAVQYLNQSGFPLSDKTKISDALKMVRYNYEDCGFAYYAGLKGDVWDKKAIDITFEGTKRNIDLLNTKQRFLKDIISKALKPSSSGLLLRNMYFIVSEEDYEIVLPKEQGESFEVLSRDIYDALAKKEPTLVLDRLHTYSMKYLRELCSEHGISMENAGEKYALHSLVGMLIKHYTKEKKIQSEFTEQALMMSISAFEKFNSVRNDQSYAHDNNIINDREAAYVVRIITATLFLLHEIENM